LPVRRATTRSLVAGTAAAPSTSPGLPLRTELTGTVGSDLLQINAGDGNDSVDVNAAAKKFITVAVDLGGRAALTASLNRSSPQHPTRQGP